jgi:hypothetical protein
MNKEYGLIILIFFFGCGPQNSQINDMNFWKMEWQMVENVLDEEYELAAEQFDNLLNINKEMSRNAFVSGLMAKLELNRNEEVIELLSNKPILYKRLLCEKLSSVSLDVCDSIPIEIVENGKLRDELATMYVIDQYVRGNIMTKMIEKYNLDTVHINSAIYEDPDADNVKELKHIIENFGFPTKEMVGLDAMNGVFYIIQHAQDLNFQEQMLPKIKLATENNSLEQDALAYLTDRILIRNEKKQLYGTQVESLNIEKREVVFFPIEDSLNIDQRRLKLGMEPFDFYKKVILKSFDQ